MMPTLRELSNDMLCSVVVSPNMLGEAEIGEARRVVGVSGRES